MKSKFSDLLTVIFLVLSVSMVLNLIYELVVIYLWNGGNPRIKNSSGIVISMLIGCLIFSLLNGIATFYFSKTRRLSKSIISWILTLILSTQFFIFLNSSDKFDYPCYYAEYYTPGRCGD